MEIRAGVSGGHDGIPGQVPAGTRRKPPVRRSLGVGDYVAGVRAGDRTLLSRAITLIESRRPAHAEMAREVLAELRREARTNAMRVGITGVPGAGKSTFIEALGNLLCDEGRKLAVLAVDPSSAQSGGSILGDKTRMETLVHRPEAYIRPSPSGGTLGGVARKSRETILLCESAGFDTVIVETVGVGQSEGVVRSLVDCFLLLHISGAGDELQGIKKGVIELADLMVVNKADGDNVARARRTAGELSRVLEFLRPATEGWKTPAMTCSALTGEGVKDVWSTVERFYQTVRESGVFESRRREQEVAAMRKLLEEFSHAFVLSLKEVAEAMPEFEKAVAGGRMTPGHVVDEVEKRVRKRF